MRWPAGSLPQRHYLTWSILYWRCHFNLKLLATVISLTNYNWLDGLVSLSFSPSENAFVYTAEALDVGKGDGDIYDTYRYK